MDFNIDNYFVNVSFLSMLFVFISVGPILVSWIAIVRIVQRAGFSGWWSLVIFVPILNMLALWYFGFGPWPIFDELGSSGREVDRR